MNVNVNTSEIIFALDSPAMRAVQRRASKLTSRRKASQFHRGWLADHDLVGAYGEAAFAIFMGAQIQSAWANAGDKGVDVFDSVGYSYDVKASTLSRARLMMPVADYGKNTAMRFVLAIVAYAPGKDVAVRIAGWIDRNAFLRDAIRLDLKVPTLALDQDLLEKPWTLEPLKFRSTVGMIQERTARASFRSFDERIEALARGEE